MPRLNQGLGECPLPDGAMAAGPYAKNRRSATRAALCLGGDLPISTGVGLTSFSCRPPLFTRLREAIGSTDWRVVFCVNTMKTIGSKLDHSLWVVDTSRDTLYTLAHRSRLSVPRSPYPPDLGLNASRSPRQCCS